MLNENKYFLFFKKYINFILYFILFLGVLIFVFNPFNILNYYKIPFIILFLILFFSSILTTLNLYSSFLYFLFYIGVFILLFGFMFILINLITIITNKIIIQPFSIIMLYYIVIVSLIVSISGIDVGNYSYSKINSVSNLFYYIFVYIPCFLKDTIDYFVEDYKNTNTTTFILFIILLFMLAFNYFQSMDINNGDLLLGDKKLLNQELISISLKELKQGNIKELFTDMAELESKNTYQELENHYNIIQKTIKEQSPFKNNKLKDVVNKYEDDPEKLKNEINKKLEKHFFTKLYYRFILFKNTLFTNTNATNLSYKDIISEQLSPTIHNYHYGLSFWLFLDTNIKDSYHIKKDLILSISNTPTLYYDYSKQLLIIEFINKHNNKIIYTTDKIIFQRWNHIVLNYVNGTFDIFVNKNLVSTSKNVSPYINDEDKLIIGDDNNSSLCGIAQVRFFKQPIDKSKIKNLYNYNNDLI